MNKKDYEHLIPKGYAHLSYYANGTFLKDIEEKIEESTDEENKSEEKPKRKRGKQ